MGTSEVIALISVILAIIVVISTFFYRVFKELKSIREEEEVKRSRVYQRLDEVKDTSKKEFVSKEICKITHDYTNEKLQIIQDQTACIPKIKASLDILLSKNNISNN